MSYDVYLRAPNTKCDHCGHVEDAEPDCPEPTYNLTPIFDLALTGGPLPNPEVSEGAVVILKEKTDRPRGLRLLNGKLAKDTLAELDAAIGRLEDPSMREAFIRLEPPNKWGDLNGAVWVMRRLRELAGRHLNHRWEVG